MLNQVLFVPEGIFWEIEDIISLSGLFQKVSIESKKMLC